jgi:hypothetical protein
MLFIRELLISLEKKINEFPDHFDVEKVNYRL